MSTWRSVQLSLPPETATMMRSPGSTSAKSAMASPAARSSFFSRRAASVGGLMAERGAIMYQTRPPPARPGASPRFSFDGRAAPAIKAPSLVVRSRMPMPAKDLGTKHTCFKCGTKFYDMKKPEPICPKCGADQRQSPASKPSPAAERRSRPAKPVAPVEPEVAEEAEAADVEEDADAE